MSPLFSSQTKDAFASLAWEDDALLLPTQAEPVLLRYTFGNVRSLDREAFRAGLPRTLEMVHAFGPDEAARFLRHFAEDEAGKRLYETEEEAWEGVRGCTFARVQAAYAHVFNRLTEEMGWTAASPADGDAVGDADGESSDGAEGKGPAPAGAAS